MSAFSDLFPVCGVTAIADFMVSPERGLEFDASDRCRNLWRVEVPASTPGSDIKPWSMARLFSVKESSSVSSRRPIEPARRPTEQA
jgi:hypothetical protein